MVDFTKLQPGSLLLLNRSLLSFDTDDDFIEIGAPSVGIFSRIFEGMVIVHLGGRLNVRIPIFYVNDGWVEIL